MGFILRVFASQAQLKKQPCLKGQAEAKRKRWLDRSGSLRLVGKTKSLNPAVAVSNSSSNASGLTMHNYTSPWSSPESERRAYQFRRNRSVDRALDEDDPGKVKGFVNR